MHPMFISGYSRITTQSNDFFCIAVEVEMCRIMLFPEINQNPNVLVFMVPSAIIIFPIIRNTLSFFDMKEYRNHLL